MNIKEYKETFKSYIKKYINHQKLLYQYCKELNLVYKLFFPNKYKRKFERLIYMHQRGYFSRLTYEDSTYLLIIYIINYRELCKDCGLKFTFDNLYNTAWFTHKRFYHEYFHKQTIKYFDLVLMELIQVEEQNVFIPSHMKFLYESAFSLTNSKK